MEYAEGGDLYSLIKQNKKNNKFFTEEELWRFTYDILMGVEYLHANKIIHRDIKCLNLFMTKERRIKIGDLGVSKIVSSMDALQCTRVGTPLYLSPEQIKQVPYDYKVDIWSIGCSLYHLATFDPPFRGENLITLGNNIIKSKQKPISLIYSKIFSELIEKLLSKKSHDRPTAKEALLYLPKNVINELNVSREKLTYKIVNEEDREEKITEFIPKTTRASTNNENNKLINDAKFIQPSEAKNEPSSKLENLNNIFLENREIKKEGNVKIKPNVTNNSNNSTTLNNNVNLFLKQNRFNNILKNSTSIKNTQREREDLSSRVVNHHFNTPITKITKNYNSNSNVNTSNNNNDIEKLKIIDNSEQNNLQTPNFTKKNLQNIDRKFSDIVRSTKNIINLKDPQNLENDKSIHDVEIIKSQPEIAYPENKIGNNQDIIIDNKEEEFIIKKEEKLDLILDDNIIKKNPQISETGNFLNKRLLSSKLRAPCRFRPNTASNNKVLVPNNNPADININVADKEDAANRINELILSRLNLNNRPFTANNKSDKLSNKTNLNHINTTENKNVINININFYNIDMNKRYVNPNIQSSLIHIDQSLLPKEKNQNNAPTKERRRNLSTNPTSSSKNNFNGSSNNNNQPFVFHKIMRSIETQLT